MNCREAKEMVNTLRHERMDVIVFDNTNNEVYSRIYSEVMSSIVRDYPHLYNEVQRQLAKKIRRIEKKRTYRMNQTSEDFSKHIFDHYDCIYVVDFSQKLCWVVDAEDKDEPISTIDIKKNPSGWSYKASGCTADAPFLENLDEDWSAKMDCRYRDYVNNLILE